jgi:hypothetical protein
MSKLYIVLKFDFSFEGWVFLDSNLQYDYFKLVKYTVVKKIKNKILTKTLLPH